MMDDLDRRILPFLWVRIACEGTSSDTTAPAENKALGYTILFGNRPDKLYHSYMVFAKEGEDVEQRVGALVKGREYYVRVDAFNESGITEGSLMKLG